MNSSDINKPSQINTSIRRSESAAKKALSKLNTIGIRSIALSKRERAIKSIIETFSINALYDTIGFSIQIPFASFTNSYCSNLKTYTL